MRHSVGLGADHVEGVVPGSRVGRNVLDGRNVGAAARAEDAVLGDEECVVAFGSAETERIVTGTSVDVQRLVDHGRRTVLAQEALDRERVVAVVAEERHRRTVVQRDERVLA